MMILPNLYFESMEKMPLALPYRCALGAIYSPETNLQNAMQQIKANLPIGIDPHLVANQPKVVEDAVHDFMEALWEAVAIVLGISFLSLGLRAGIVVTISIPLVLAIVFLAMKVFGIDLQRVSLARLLFLLGYSSMTP